MAETAIRAGDEMLTLINVFTVAPERQQELIDLLVESTEQVMTRMPGFISANFHRGIDKRHVVNYAQWRSREDFEAMLQNVEAGPHMRGAAALAEFEPIVCEVVSTHHAE